MARKLNTGRKSQMAEGTVSIRFVKKAGMWCKTWFEYDHQRGTAKQMQEWTENKPENNSSK